MSPIHQASSTLPLVAWRFAAQRSMPDSSLIPRMKIEGVHNVGLWALGRRCSGTAGGGDLGSAQIYHDVVQSAKSLLLLLLRAAFRKSLLRLRRNAGLDTTMFIVVVDMTVTLEIRLDQTPSSALIGLFLAGSTKIQAENTKPGSEFFPTSVDT